MSCCDCIHYVKGFDYDMGYEYNGCNYPDHEWENFPPTGCEDKNKPYTNRRKKKVRMAKNLEVIE